MKACCRLWQKYNASLEYKVKSWVRIKNYELRVRGAEGGVKITAPPATQVDSRRGKDCNSFMGLDTVTTEGFLGSWWFFKGLWLLVFLDPDFKLSFLDGLVFLG